MPSVSSIHQTIWTINSQPGIPTPLSVDTSFRFNTRARAYATSPSPTAYTPIGQSAPEIDLSSIQSASQPLSSSLKPLSIYTGFTPLPDKMRTLKQNYRMATTFKTCFIEKLAHIRSNALDSNGEPMPFTNTMGDEDECHDIMDIYSNDNQWGSSLWDMDIHCMVGDIDVLEDIVGELEAVVPEGR